MMGTIDLKIKLEVALTQDGDQWIARCLPLDLFAQESTKESATDSLKEAIFGWFESCLERDVLAKALEEVGFRLVRRGEHVSLVELSPPQKSLQVEEVEVSIPAYIAAAFGNSAHSAAFSR